MDGTLSRLSLFLLASFQRIKPTGQKPLESQMLQFRRIRRVAVDRRVEHLFRLDKLQPHRLLAIDRAARRNLTIKTASITDVATGAAPPDRYAQPDTILVVINSHFAHTLDQAAGGSLVPQHFA